MCVIIKILKQRRLVVVKINENLASKIKNHPGFLAFWGKNVKTENVTKKEKETGRGGVKK